MKNWSNKTITLVIVIILLAINSGLLFSYYNFYLSDKMANDLAEAKRQNHESVYVITKSIEGKELDEAIYLMRIYVNNNDGYIILKDEYGNKIYSNTKDVSKLFSTTTMVNIDGENYELTYSKVSSLPGKK